GRKRKRPARGGPPFLRATAAWRQQLQVVRSRSRQRPFARRSDRARYRREPYFARLVEGFARWHAPCLRLEPRRQRKLDAADHGGGERRGARRKKRRHAGRPSAMARGQLRLLLQPAYGRGRHAGTLSRFTGALSSSR